MSNVVSDISRKILCVTISLIAFIAISKDVNALVSTILVLEILIASALLAETLAAQKLQYDRIKHSRLILFSSHQQKLSQYPTDLRNYIDESVIALVANEAKLKRSIMMLRCLSWLPAMIATSVHAYIYRYELSEGVMMIANFGCEFLHLFCA
ncbi:hypothetical protein GIV96_24560 [Pseudomonas syringae]|uniref:hypothetical protein n=1 Tax=Pseudomonas syringae TaxID=317 RepID=UPI001F29BE84|nr:hypothetical protein [Pseudomonas syringae]MCF5403165.1 hypothetical protein [Pseudomonas syringae]